MATTYTHTVNNDNYSSIKTYYLKPGDTMTIKTGYAFGSIYFGVAGTKGTNEPKPYSTYETPPLTYKNERDGENYSLLSATGVLNEDKKIYYVYTVDYNQAEITYEYYVGKICIIVDSSIHRFDTTSIEKGKTYEINTKIGDTIMVLTYVNLGMYSGVYCKKVDDVLVPQKWDTYEIPPGMTYTSVGSSEGVYFCSAEGRMAKSGTFGLKLVYIQAIVGGEAYLKINVEGKSNDMKIKTEDGAWKEGKTYIFTGDQWRDGEVYIYTENGWKKGV